MNQRTTTYPSVAVTTRRITNGVQLEIVVGHGISVDLGLGKFPGMPNASLEGMKPAGGVTVDLTGPVTIHEVAKSLETYFAALAKASEPLAVIEVAQEAQQC